MLELLLGVRFQLFGDAHEFRAFELPELGDAIHDDEVNIGVLRRRRGSLTDEECIARVTDLLSYGVGERKSCRVVGVIWREWNEWKRAKLHNLEQQLAFAKLVRINAMHDEIMEIADDPDLLKPDTKQVKHTREDGSEYETTEVVLTPSYWTVQRVSHPASSSDRARAARPDRWRCGGPARAARPTTRERVVGVTIVA